MAIEPTILSKNMRVGAAKRLTESIEKLVSGLESSELLTIGPEVCRKMLLGMAESGTERSVLEELVSAQIQIALGLVTDAKVATAQTKAFVALLDRAYGKPSQSGQDEQAALKRVGVYVSQLAVLDRVPTVTVPSTSPRLETSASVELASETSGTPAP